MSADERAPLGDIADVVERVEGRSAKEIAPLLEDALAIVGPEITDQAQSKALVVLAARAFDTGLWREAIRLVIPVKGCGDPARSSYEDRLKAHLIEGLSLKQLGDVRHAVAAFASAQPLVEHVSNAHTLFQYHANFATALQDAGRTEAALAEFALAEEHAAAVNDRILTAFHLNRSMARLDDGDTAAAIHDLERALQLDDGSLEAHLRMSLGNAYLQVDDLDRAEENYERALRSLDGAAPGMEGRIHNNVGRLLSRRGQHDQAIERIQRGLELRRAGQDTLGQAASLYTLTEVLLRTDRDAEALDVLDEAIDLLAAVDHPDLVSRLQLGLALEARLAGRAELDEGEVAVAAAISIPNRDVLRELADRFPILTSGGADDTWDRLEQRFAARPSILFRIRARRRFFAGSIDDNGAGGPGGAVVQRALEELIHAAGGAAMEASLRAHRNVLLTDIAIDMLDASRAIWAQRERPHLVEQLNRIRQLLVTARESGIEAGLAELRARDEAHDRIIALANAYLTRDDWLSKKRYFQRHADQLLAEEILATLEGTSDGLEESSPVKRGLDELIGLWHACHERGLSVAFAELPVAAPAEWLARIVNVGSWEETRELITAHAEMLESEEIFGVLRDMLDQVGSEELNRVRIEDHVALLKACREEGIEAAFADRSGFKTYVTSIELSPGHEAVFAENTDELRGLEQTVMLLERAGSEPLLVGSLHNSIAVRYLEREQGDEEANLALAQEHLGKALWLLDEGLHPQTASRAMNNTGNLCRRYARLRQEERQAYLLRAIGYFDDALRIQTPAFMAETARVTARNLYGALMELREEERSPRLMERVADVCRDALDATDALARSGSPAEIRALVEEAEWAVQGAVAGRFALRQYGAALEASERGKGRAFAARLLQMDRGVPPRVPAELLDRERVIRAELAEAFAESAEEDEGAPLARGARIARANSALDDLYEQMEPFAPEFVAVRRNRPMDFVELARYWRNSGRLCLEWHLQAEGGYLFVVGPDSEVEAHAIPFAFEELSNHVRLAMDEFWHRPDDPQDGISPLWSALSERLFPSRVRERIREARGITLVPNGIQRFLPLHALPMNWLDGEPLLARMPVRYVPSLTLGRRLARRARPPTGANLALGYSGSHAADDVLEQEARLALEALGEPEAALATGRDATLDWLATAGREAARIHLSCHAFFDGASPADSGLVLAAPEGGGDLVATAEDIVETLELDSSLVVLSGCETAQGDPGSADEMIGLVRAFFVAGAGTVLASLWRVDAAVTMMMMRRFYEALREGGSPAESLRRAALSVRASPATRHPYYWAPFIAYEA